MRLPRDLSGQGLIKSLQKIGYNVTRQSGSHVRLTCDKSHQHHITVPDHTCLRLGTLSAILDDVALHQQLDRLDLLNKLFGR